MDVFMKRFLPTLVLALVICLTVGPLAGAQAVVAITGNVAEVDKYGNVTLDLKTQVLLDAGLSLAICLPLPSVNMNSQLHS